MAAEEILETRQAIYGDATESHARIAEVWTGILNTPVNAHQVALMMVGLKLVRADISPHHADNLVDAAGYVEIARQIIEKQTVSHE